MPPARRSRGSPSPRRVLKRRSSAKARTSRRAAVTRRSPKRRTYKGTRVYGMITGAGGDDPSSNSSGKRPLDGDGRGDPSKKLRAGLPETIQELLANLERGEEHQMRKARAQVGALLHFMAQQQVQVAIQSAAQRLNEADLLLDLQYGHDPELIHAFVPILDTDNDSDATQSSS